MLIELQTQATLTVSVVGLPGCAALQPGVGAAAALCVAATLRAPLASVSFISCADPSPPSPATVLTVQAALPALQFSLLTPLRADGSSFVPATGDLAASALWQAAAPPNFAAQLALARAAAAAQAQAWVARFSAPIFNADGTSYPPTLRLDCSDPATAALAAPMWCAAAPLPLDLALSTFFFAALALPVPPGNASASTGPAPGVGAIAVKAQRISSTLVYPSPSATPAGLPTPSASPARPALLLPGASAASGSGGGGGGGGVGVETLALSIALGVLTLGVLAAAAWFYLQRLQQGKVPGGATAPGAAQEAAGEGVTSGRPPGRGALVMSENPLSAALAEQRQQGLGGSNAAGHGSAPQAPPVMAVARGRAAARAGLGAVVAVGGAAGAGAGEGAEAEAEGGGKPSRLFAYTPGPWGDLQQLQPRGAGAWEDANGGSAARPADARPADGGSAARPEGGGSVQQLLQVASQARRAVPPHLLLPTWQPTRPRDRPRE